MNNLHGPRIRKRQLVFETRLAWHCDDRLVEEARHSEKQNGGNVPPLSETLVWAQYEYWLA